MRGSEHLYLRHSDKGVFGTYLRVLSVANPLSTGSGVPEASWEGSLTPMLSATEFSTMEVYFLRWKMCDGGEVDGFPTRGNRKA